MKDIIEETFFSLGGVIGLALLVFCVIIVTLTVTSSEEETKRMTACVQAGKTWVRTADAPYHMECK